MFNEFTSIGNVRSLLYKHRNRTGNGVPKVLIGYWINNNNANRPQPGETEDYQGEPMPNEYLEFLLEIIEEYYDVTTYSMANRMTPLYPAPGEVRYRDCSSFIWDVLNRAGFSVTSYTWSTATQYLFYQDYQISAEDRQPGDIIIYWKTSGNPVGGSAEHTMFYIGNDWYIDCTGGTLTAVQQRNNYNLDSGLCRFFRIPDHMYPELLRRSSALLYKYNIGR